MPPAFTPPVTVPLGASAEATIVLERERWRDAKQAARVQVAKAKTSCATRIAWNRSWSRYV